MLKQLVLLDLLLPWLSQLTEYILAGPYEWECLEQGTVVGMIYQKGSARAGMDWEQCQVRDKKPFRGA